MEGLSSVEGRSGSVDEVERVTAAHGTLLHSIRKCMNMIHHDSHEPKPVIE